MKALLLISLLWALFSLGTPLRQCYSCAGDDCETPRIQDCDADQDACYTSVSENNLVSSLMPNYKLNIKSCITADMCLGNYVSLSTLNGGNFSMNTQCCYTDLCNDMSISLPELVRSHSNGLQCRSCLIIDRTECEEEEEEIIDCTGGETKCFEETAEVLLDILDEEFTVYMKGCATPNICSLPPPSLKSDKLNFTVTEWGCLNGLLETTGKIKPFFGVHPSQTKSRKLGSK